MGSNSASRASLRELKNRLSAPRRKSVSAWDLDTVVAVHTSAKHTTSTAVTKITKRRLQSRTDASMRSININVTKISASPHNSAPGVVETGPDLEGGPFSGIVMQDAIFRGANLKNADLTDANTEGADFAGANMSGVRGLQRSREASEAIQEALATLSEFDEPDKETPVIVEFTVGDDMPQQEETALDVVRRPAPDASIFSLLRYLAYVRVQRVGRRIRSLWSRVFSRKKK